MVSRATIELVCPGPGIPGSVPCGVTFWLRPREHNPGHRQLRTRCGVCRAVRKRWKAKIRQQRRRDRLRHAG